MNPHHHDSQSSEYHHRPMAPQAIRVLTEVIDGYCANPTGEGLSSLKTAANNARLNFIIDCDLSGVIDETVRRSLEVQYDRALAAVQETGIGRGHSPSQADFGRFGKIVKFAEMSDREQAIAALTALHPRALQMYRVQLFPLLGISSGQEDRWGELLDKVRQAVETDRCRLRIEDIRADFLGYCSRFGMRGESEDDIIDLRELLFPE